MAGASHTESARLDLVCLVDKDTLFSATRNKLTFSNLEFLIQKWSSYPGLTRMEDVYPGWGRLCRATLRQPLHFGHFFSLHNSLGIIQVVSMEGDYAVCLPCPWLGDGIFTEVEGLRGCWFTASSLESGLLSRDCRRMRVRQCARARVWLIQFFEFLGYITIDLVYKREK